MIRRLMVTLWKLENLLWLFKSDYARSPSTADFSISIVTYIERFDEYFKPLFRHLSLIFPDTQIVVVVNGYYNQQQQANYLLSIKEFLASFGNAVCISFEQPQSLSKLWNLGIRHATSEKILILNDDLKITPWFRRRLLQSNILNEDMALINRSWSHFLISKSTIEKIGWFDERFPAMGNEDEDYECRLAIANTTVRSYKNRQVLNVIAEPKTYSYGPDVAIVNGKYIKDNQKFFDQKWELSTAPKENFVYVKILNKFVQQRTGMETPNFYGNT